MKTKGKSLSSRGNNIFSGLEVVGRGGMARDSIGNLERIDKRGVP